MSKYTPGPWVVVEENDGEGPIEVRAPPYIVARVFTDPARYTIANAQLIAAAPDLVVALGMASDLICSRLCGGSDHHDHAEECVTARAALAKAGVSHE